MSFIELCHEWLSQSSHSSPHRLECDLHMVDSPCLEFGRSTLSLLPFIASGRIRTCLLWHLTFFITSSLVSLSRMCLLTVAFWKPITVPLRPSLQSHVTKHFEVKRFGPVVACHNRWWRVWQKFDHSFLKRKFYFLKMILIAAVICNSKERIFYIEIQANISKDWSHDHDFDLIW